MSEAYRSRRDQRFDHSSDAIEHIEAVNCSKGCKVPEPADIVEYGPGGNCLLLVTVSIGDGDPIPGLVDDGTTIRCTAREPLES